MDWLVTFTKDIPPEEMKRILAQGGCTEDLSPPIPLGENEQVVSTTGPADLPTRLRDERGVLKVSPNSSLTLY